MIERRIAQLVEKARRLWWDEPWQVYTNPQPGFTIGLKYKARFSDVLSELWDGNGGPYSSAELQEMFTNLRHDHG